jgi:hypothetical protein
MRLLLELAGQADPPQQAGKIHQHFLLLLVVAVAEQALALPLVAATAALEEVHQEVLRVD